jgi:hypothetical protein
MNVILRGLRCCSGKAVIVTYSESAFLALVIENAKRMGLLYCHFGLSGSTIFSALYHKRHDFRNKVIQYKMHVLVFSITYIGNISHHKKNSADTVMSVQTSSCNVPVILDRF